MILNNTRIDANAIRTRVTPAILSYAMNYTRMIILKMFLKGDEIETYEFVGSYVKLPFAKKQFYIRVPINREDTPSNPKCDLILSKVREIYIILKPKCGQDDNE